MVNEERQGELGRIPPALPLKKGRAMRVLLIEDEPTTAKSIELMLHAEGFNVYTTDLGEEGLDLGKLYDYDIILLDLNLPDMHGYDVLKKLRLAKVGTPVLILSGISEMDSKVRALGFGADDYVTKPFHRDELVARIHAVVRRSKGHPHRQACGEPRRQDGRSRQRASAPDGQGICDA
jgi:DNA-binding response OmpR family regulator